MKNYTRKQLEDLIKKATQELKAMDEQQPEIVLNSRGAVTFKNMTVKKVNRKSIVVADTNGNEYLFQGKPHKGGYTSGPRIPVKYAKYA